MKKSFFKKVLWCGLYSGLEFNEDDFKNFKASYGLHIEDPWERVKTIFQKDNFGSMHPELVRVLQNTQLGILAGFIYGGALSNIQGTENYIRNTETNIYKNKKDAFKSFFGHSFLSFGKGGVKWAPKFGFFFCSFTFLSSCGMLYRNKHGILENTLAGSFTGALCKFSFGLPGLISGGVFGGLMGTFYGIVLWCVQKITNKDQMELKYAQFAYMKYREKFSNVNPNEKPMSHKLQESHILHVDNPLNHFDVDVKKVQPIEEEKNNQQNEEQKKVLQSEGEKSDEGIAIN